uniref:Uncharacterized protein n=1 Tax=Lutzomyia longipalpis TaxID=7200 RepID=A0A1B0EU31_LUTLO
MPTDADDSIDAFQQYYRRPVQKSKKESFLKFIYDPKKKSVFGRTGPSWKSLSPIRITISTNQEENIYFMKPYRV